jgi:hypothetical protein
MNLQDPKGSVSEQDCLPQRRTCRSVIWSTQRTERPNTRHSQIGEEILRPQCRSCRHGDPQSSICMPSSKNCKAEREPFLQGNETLLRLQAHWASPDLRISPPFIRPDHKYLCSSVCHAHMVKEGFKFKPSESERFTSTPTPTLNHDLQTT